MLHAAMANRCSPPGTADQRRYAPALKPQEQPTYHLQCRPNKIGCQVKIRRAGRLRERQRHHGGEYYADGQRHSRDPDAAAHVAPRPCACASGRAWPGRHGGRGLDAAAAAAPLAEHAAQRRGGAPPKSLKTPKKAPQREGDACEGGRDSSCKATRTVGTSREAGAGV